MMFQLALVDDAYVQKEICKKRGIPYHDDILIYIGMEETAFLGVCIFTFRGKNGVVSFLDQSILGDPPLCDVYLRAVLSYMQGNGVETAELAVKIPESVKAIYSSIKIGGQEKYVIRDFTFSCCGS